MDPRTLETSRPRLLALQQQRVQRIFDLEASMLAMDADRDIERTDRVQEEAAEVALTALDEQGRHEMEAIQAALARIDVGTYGIGHRAAPPLLLVLEYFADPLLESV